MFHWFLNWKASTRRSAIMLCLLCGPLSLVTALYYGHATSTRAGLNMQAVYSAGADQVRATAFAHDFLALALSGNTEQHSKALAAMSSIHPSEFALNPDPVKTGDITLLWPMRNDGEDGTSAWQFIFQVTLYLPFEQRGKRHLFRVECAERNGGYQATAWPELITQTAPAIAVDTGYPTTLAVDSPIGSQVSEFLRSFYVSSDKARSAGIDSPPITLNRVISENFHATPIGDDSPFIDVALTAITAAKTKTDLRNPKPGDQALVLATFIGKITGSTFLNQQVPLKLSFTKNQQWLVDSIDSTVYFGGTHAR